MSQVERIIEQAEEMSAKIFSAIEKRSFINQRRVLRAFREAKVADFHLHGSTGYGYGDAGRTVVEELYAKIFFGQKALVRGQFASGTHALSCAMFGVLRPSDELVVATGTPYDTLHGVIGLKGAGQSSLAAWGVSAKVVPRLLCGGVDLATLRQALTARTKLVHIQRSRGYEWRAALSLMEISQIIELVKGFNKQIVCLVDNCYGEFVDISEPGECGADLTVGSLIKNPGGGVALTGGYIVGQEEQVNLATERLYAPGLTGEIGASTTFTRGFLQGLFLAPALVEYALKGAVLLAQAGTLLGLETSPAPDDERGDIIQAIKVGSRGQLIKFCQAIQRASPIDSHVVPEPGELPGYKDAVIMAAGTFVLGASSEFSADAPLREPYIAYVQGALSYGHVKVALSEALEALFY